MDKQSDKGSEKGSDKGSEKGNDKRSEKQSDKRSDKQTNSKIWNAHFSEKDKKYHIELCTHFTEKGIKENISEIMASMIIFKEKYGIKYSEEQELFIRKKH